MFRKLSKRKRQILVTTLLSAGCIAAAMAFVLFASGPDVTYRPGELAEGITTNLDRTIPVGYHPIRFENVADSAGLLFRHFAGVRSSQLPEDMGSGAAWGDYDGDGYPDLFIAALPGPLTLGGSQLLESESYSRLFRNNGDGTFTDVTAEAGLETRDWANAAAWGDFDRDGHPDLIVASYRTLRLFRNLGDGTFGEFTRPAGLDDFNGFWVGVSLADYDEDGFLDFYVCGYVRYERPEHPTMTRQYGVENPASINPSAFPPERNLLFRNTGGMTFEEVALKAGVMNADGRSLSASWTDFDEDGWIDLYVANDVSDNALFRNLGNGTFEDASHSAWVADYRGAMGLAVGDWDADLDQDIVVTHWIAQENALYNNMLSESRRSGNRLLRFMDEADQYGLGQISLDYIGWGTSFLDFDNDGRLDLLVVNGSTLQESDDPSRLGAMTSQLYWNGGPDAGFYDVSAVSGPYFSELHVGRGAAISDYDRDGDLDVVIVNHGGHVALLRNDSSHENGWISIRLVGTQSNPAGIGARIRVVAAGLEQVRHVGAQSSYASQNDMAEHLGLGALSVVDSLEIIWPSGMRQVLIDVPARQHLQVTEPLPPS